MSTKDDIVRAHIWVMGYVQGVGFRAHVEYHARRLRLSGWVRNIGDDTVEAVAEGRRDSMDAFIMMVKRGPRGARVNDSRLEWETPTGEFAGFGVRRSP